MIIQRLRKEQLHNIPGALDLLNSFERTIETEVNSSIFHVAVYDSKAIGFAATSVKASGEDVVGFLDAAYVSPEYRGNEVFTRLYGDIKEVCRNFQIDRIQLEVDYNNADAYDIYRHLGFENKVVLMEATL